MKYKSVIVLPINCVRAYSTHSFNSISLSSNRATKIQHLFFENLESRFHGNWNPLERFFPIAKFRTLSTKNDQLLTERLFSSNSMSLSSNRATKIQHELFFEI